MYFAGRNEAALGYSKRFDVFALRLRSGVSLVSYGDAAQDRIGAVDFKLPLH